MDHPVLAIVEIDSHMQWVLGITLVLYTIGMYALGYFAQRQIKDEEDFLVAGRRLPLSLAWLTLLATWFGAGTLLTATDTVGNESVPGAALDPFGAGACLLLAGLFVAGPMWRAKLLTVPDLFRRKYGAGAELISSLIMVPSYFGWIAAQFLALAEMMHIYFGMPVGWGVLVVAIIGTGYTLMGGMWSVTLTDAVQMSLVMLGLIVLGGGVLAEWGDGQIHAGWLKMTAQTSHHWENAIPRESLAAFMPWLTAFLIGALGNLPGQDLMQRIFAAKSERVAKWACYIAGIMYLGFGLIPVALGVTASEWYPSEIIAEGKLISKLALLFLNPVMFVIFILALVSAVLSTIDSAILAPASVLSQNVFPKIMKVPMLTLNRYSVLLVAACSLGLAYLGEDAYSLLEDAYSITLVGLLVPMMFALYIEPRHHYSGVLSMLTGFGLWVLHYVKGWEDSFLQGIELVGNWGLPMEITITLLGLLVYLCCEPPWTFRKAKDSV